MTAPVWRALVPLLLALATLQAQAEDRSQLVACQTMLEHAAQSAAAAGAKAPSADAEIVRCRQIVREWTLRDARMSVDEKGRPIR
jgi:GAF domain-containing protein